jgi:hypothetical protein
VSDLDELRAVLEECSKRKLIVTAVQVGTIRLSFVPVPPEEAKSPTKRKTAEELELEKLRKSSRKTFGRVLPDEELLNLKGAI